MHHYTGLESWDNFNIVFNLLMVGSDENAPMKEYDLSSKTCFLILLVYLRCHFDYFELGRMFSISKSYVRKIITSWLKFSVSQFKKIDIWPEKSLVQFFSPTDFKFKFSQTRIIIDGTEIPIMKSSHRKAQRVTWSNYKNKNTAKVLVGATPGGLVSYGSDSYGGGLL